MTPLDQDEINEVDLKIRDYFDDLMAKHLPKMIKEHTAVCPHGQKITQWRGIAIGLAVGIGFNASAAYLKAAVSLL